MRHGCPLVAADDKSGLARAPADETRHQLVAGDAGLIRVKINFLLMISRCNYKTRDARRLILRLESTVHSCAADCGTFAIAFCLQLLCLLLYTVTKFYFRHEFCQFVLYFNILNLCYARG